VRSSSDLTCWASAAASALASFLVGFVGLVFARLRFVGLGFAGLVFAGLVFAALGFDALPRSPALAAAEPPAREATRTIDPREMERKSRWLEDRILSAPGLPASADRAPAFSFVYGGKPSGEGLPAWPRVDARESLSRGRTRHTSTWTDAATGLEVRRVAVEYSDFPALEWTVHFKQLGDGNTPILESIQAIDARIGRADGCDAGEWLLRSAKGDTCAPDLYEPLEQVLGPGADLRFAPAGGRGTNGAFPYYNLVTPTGGMFLAVGWPGQWASRFHRDAERGLEIAAGQERTRMSLQKGEEVRTPLVALLFWSGSDLDRAQNLWRRWMIAHVMPRPGGQLPPPQLLASSSRQYDEMIRANETNQIHFINRYLEEGLRLDYWWMDAGWYVHHGGGWPRVGTWLVDSNRFPRGLRAVSDHARQRNVKTLVWFEPERVAAGTWLAQEHPEWVLGGTNGGLLNLGLDAARQWLTEHVDSMITEQGIDLYRQDFNMDPLGHWRAADAPDRQGITEIRHVTGYLAYWDELRRRHPGLLIDSCASGGRRNDLETMRRAVPLWRSDYAYEAIGHQCMTYGISLWLPFHGTGTVATRNAPYYGSGLTPIEPYAFWSNTTPSLGCGFDMREPLDYSALRRLIAQWRQVSPCYYGDFWPLTAWNRDPTLWMAWQFDCPETGTGMLQAFRRHDSLYESARLTLRGLDPEARYFVADVNAADTGRTWSGRELLETGLPLAIADRPGALVLSYSKHEADRR